MSLLDLEELHSARRTTQLLRLPPEMDVPVTKRVLSVIDTPAFRRLNEISQLGLVKLVYPGAVHSRFEHSLGVYRLALLALEHLAGEAAFASTFTPYDAKLLVLAALLHDVGHWPYCHAIEDMRLPSVARHEEHARQLICTGELAEIIRSEWQVDCDHVADLIAPPSGAVFDGAQALAHSLLSGPIDIDKLDYLQRDSLHAGVPYGRNFDQRRLIASLCLGPAEREIAITAKGKTAAEMLVFSRYVMFSEVYWHHAVRSATAMLQRLVHLVGQSASSSSWLNWSDQQMQAHLRAAARDVPGAETLAEGLFGPKRLLYKRLLEFNFSENPQAHRALARRSYATLAEFSTASAERLSRYTTRPLAPTDILIDAPPVKLEVQFQLAVRQPSGEFQSLAALSPVVHSLATEQFDNYVKRVHVFIAPHRQHDLNLKTPQLIDELMRVVS